MYGSAGRADCFSPRKALWCARRHILPPCGYADSPKGCRGASGKPPACIDKRQLCRKQFPLAGPDAPIPARGKGLQPYGALYCSGGDPKGPGASGKPPVRPQAHTPCPGWRLTRRLRRGWWGFRPEGGSTFFRRERKYQRKPAARRLREKALYCPF